MHARPATSATGQVQGAELEEAYAPTRLCALSSPFSPQGSQIIPVQWYRGALRLITISVKTHRNYCCGVKLLNTFEARALVGKCKRSPTSNQGLV